MDQYSKLCFALNEATLDNFSWKSGLAASALQKSLLNSDHNRLEELGGIHENILTYLQASKQQANKLILNKIVETLNNNLHHLRSGKIRHFFAPQACLSTAVQQKVHCILKVLKHTHHLSVCALVGNSSKITFGKRPRVDAGIPAPIKRDVAYP